MQHQRYTQLLLRWLEHARMHLYTLPDHPDLTCYGTGYNTWGVQTNQKALSAYGVLATDPHADFSAAGTTREEVLDTALAMLRFSLRSHLTGDVRCTDGEQWGHTWISVLGIERMMHAVDALQPHMTQADTDLLHRVLVSEAD